MQQVTREDFPNDYTLMDVTRPLNEEFQEVALGVAPRAYRLALRIVGDASDAEDCVAEALARTLVAWGRISRHPWREGWVLRVTANVAIDMVRKRRPCEDIPEMTATTPDIESSLVLHSALGRLPRRQRQVLALRYLADLADDEIAASLGISVGSVKKHSARGLASLRSNLAASFSEVNLAW